MELAKAYNPKEAEENHYKRWEESGCFTPEINENVNAEKYSIVIPPPNVTGSLHMGHALQHTIMDSLIRRKRMQGFKTLWLLGTDHAGISVQRKVTEQIRDELGKTPQEVGREEFLKRAWAWKEKYGGTILEQMKREGASVDWTRERFTMSEQLSNAVRNVFIKLYEEGAIYRGARIVNWCPNDKTVLSDLEVEDKDKKDGKLYFLNYPIKDSDKILTVATTRPETMLGDTAVAVNPNDTRFKNLIGKTVALPLTNREIPIIADEYVDVEFGTGAVKITPAHDPNDYEMGKRHNLPELNVMNLDGTMNAEAGAEFDGLDRYKARKLVVEKFEELGLLEKIDDHEMVLPICERCKTVVETLISEQWWVRMDEMRDLALELKHESDHPRFTPHNPHTKVYTDWLENLRDWTISRQLWWGHQIPAWYDEKGNTYVAKSLEEAIEKAGTEDLTQDDDVLDTWFSSWLWSFSTMGWDGETMMTEDLKTFHPTNVLVTARDIIFLWVSRMVMSSMKFVGERPFDDVYITGTIMGSDGKPMSKTRGNGVDPIEMFEKYGVDATRIYLASISTGMDIKWSDLKIESYRNFANKIWNATRFCLMNAEGAGVDLSTLENAESIADRWIISRLNKTTKEVNKALDKYAFHVAVDKLYHFFWDDFCDWYIELSKDEITAGDVEATTRIITILEQSLRLLHPFMPYLTEELWQKLPGANAGLHNSAYKSADATIMLADFPQGLDSLIDEKAEAEMQTIFELITKIRNIRAEMQIKPSDKISVHIATDDKTKKILAANEAQVLKLARANELILGETLNVPAASAKGVLTNGSEIAIPLEGLIDFEKERERLQNQINKLEAEGERLTKQLSNENFVNKAPSDKVDAVRERVAEIETQTKALHENLETLK
jgi:valyl-tRNA synthetase